MANFSALFLTLGSFLLTGLTIGNAFFQKRQFYPSVVYITKSSPSMAVMYIQALVLAYMVFQIIRKLFFGELRTSEMEHLSERTWHAVMETCLAFTVFRDDFSPRFVMQFVMLLFVKSFHWLSEDRIDFMERSPVITVRFHVRMITLIAFLSALDSYFISHAYFTTLLRGASVQIVFGFEYAILLTMVLHVAIKYILHMHDLRNAHPWENKAVYLLYSELLINLLRCFLYVLFVGVMMRLHTFPLFSIRPLYLTVRAFHKAIQDVILSRRAIHAMNNLFPVATEQELIQGDSTCIICREEMTVGSGAKKLPCSHIFHANCLRSWFQRQQSCPTCRTDILAHRRANIPAPQAAPVVQAPAAGPQPLNNQPVMPNMFPFMQFHFPPQQFQQQQANADAGQQQPGGSVPQMPQAGPEGNAQNAPPFPFMPIPPPPLPPVPSFAGLSDEEVASMEGNERAAIEARVTCLRNIGLLLDAAVMQMQQYMSVVQSANTTTQLHLQGTQPQSSLLQNFPPIAPRTTDTDTSTTASAPTLSTTPSRSANVEEPMPGTSHAATGNIPDDSSRGTTRKPSSPQSDDLSEIRQRRLQKFEKRAGTSNETSD